MTPAYDYDKQNPHVGLASGARVYLSPPAIHGELDLVKDILFPLSRVARWSGQVSSWSVLQHTLLVESLVGPDPQDRISALIHDFTEVITSDIPSPVKSMLRVHCTVPFKDPDFYEPTHINDVSFHLWEEYLLKVICSSLGIDGTITKACKQADQEAGRREHAYHFGKVGSVLMYNNPVAMWLYTFNQIQYELDPKSQSFQFVGMAGDLFDLVRRSRLDPSDSSTEKDAN